MLAFKIGTNNKKLLKSLKDYADFVMFNILVDLKIETIDTTPTESNVLLDLADALMYNHRLTSTQSDTLQNIKDKQDNNKEYYSRLQNRLDTEERLLDITHKSSGICEEKSDADFIIDRVVSSFRYFVADINADIYVDLEGMIDDCKDNEVVCILK